HAVRLGLKARQIVPPYARVARSVLGRVVPDDRGQRIGRRQLLLDDRGNLGAVLWRVIDVEEDEELGHADMQAAFAIDPDTRRDAMTARKELRLEGVARDAAVLGHPRVSC